MKIKFWGVRGSTPTPQAENMRYGGNTSCVEVRINDNLYIFDCGTGFRVLGKQLVADAQGAPIRAQVFLSHFHWDHIQGIPFFPPLYEGPMNSLVFHASSRTRGLRQALDGQMADPYFPVNMMEMAAHRSFVHLDEGREEFEDCSVSAMWLNHPQGCLGFRMETPRGVFVYATDNEPGPAEFDRKVRKLAEGADILVYDAQFLPEEYQAKRRGWGHSHWREAVKVAMDSGAKELILYHHDPDNDDACVDRILQAARDHYPNVQAAYEGLELSI